MECILIRFLSHSVSLMISLSFRDQTGGIVVDVLTWNVHSIVFHEVSHHSFGSLRYFAMRTML